MQKNEIIELAQQLVDAKIEIKRLEKKQELIKLELYDSVKGGIKCNGGGVWFVEEFIEKRFKKDKLKIALKNEGLSDISIERILENSKEENPKSANIFVKLDK